MRISLGLLLSLVLALLIVPMTTEAAVSSELPLKSDYRFQDDPFLIDWTFLESTKPTDPVNLSHDDKLLMRWKEKQAKLWDNLEVGKQFTINASAYTAAADECGKSDGITSSGLKVAEKRTLACPPNFPFGAKLHIEGMGGFRCEDRGGAIKGNHIDIYMQTKTEAFAFGRKNLTAEVIQ